MHRHQLHRIAALERLVVAGLERGMRQEGRQRRGARRAVRVGIDDHPVLGHGERRLERRSGLRRRGSGHAGIGRHVLPHALLGEEGGRRVHQLAQVLDAVLAFLLGLVVGDQGAALDHVLDGLGQRERRRLVAQPLDQRDEGPDLAGGGARAHPGDRRIERGVRRARDVLQLLDRARADAARREVHHPQERGVVVRVLHQPQVGQRMLDLGALEEAQPAVDTVRDAGREQRVLEHARLRVRAVQDRHVGPHPALGDQAARLLDQPLRLLAVAVRLVDAYRLAGTGIGPELLAQARRVLADQVVGAV